jgi:tight adherence protein C
MFRYGAIALLIVAALAIVAAIARVLADQAVIRRRMQEYDIGPSHPDASANDRPAERGRLAHWLYLAGFRRPTAAQRFLVIVSAAVLGAVVAAIVFTTSPLLQVAQASAQELPGGMGMLAIPIIRIAPWMTAAIVAALPFLYVRSARRRRVAEIERDLPITLELMATLAESGIGFDAATARILDSQVVERSLARELRVLQSDLLGGRSRVNCLRSLAKRIDVVSVTIFVSAIVQAEQMGSGIASVLRQQADDLRQRRRERALEFSMALPVKQLFPLVICFLPGILIFAIAPLFAEFLRYSGSFSGP